MAIFSPSSASLTNPYKFSVYLNAAQNGTTTPTAIAYDTKIYDTGTNIDVATNKGRFTVPLTGFYYFTANAEITDGTGAGGDNWLRIDLYKNGSLAKEGFSGTSRTGRGGSIVSDLLSLSATDYIEVFATTNTSMALKVGSGSVTRFTGFLVSTT